MNAIRASGTKPGHPRRGSGGAAPFLLVAFALLFAACSGDAVSAPGPTASPASTTATGAGATTSIVEPSTTTTTLPPTTTTTTSTTTTTTIAGMAEGEQLDGERLWAMVPGNDAEVDRINLVYAGWNWDSFDDFLAVAEGTLSWGGHAYLTTNGFPTEAGKEAHGGALGLFAIEPWRSHTDWFNVWYTDLEPDHPQAWFLPNDHPFGLDDVVVITLAIDPESYDPNLITSYSGPATFHFPRELSRPAEGNMFGHVIMNLSSTGPVYAMDALPHELGHAMFSLADEYVGRVHGFDGRFDLSTWPSCAEDVVEAEEWWGDLIGQVDPMLDIWVEEMLSAGIWPEDTDALEHYGPRVAVGFVDGGCYGVPGSIRATEDSLMNTNIPVLGAVNRRWAESVLALWDPAPRA
ncbi:MAG: hypothetical protein HKN93_09310 [Acidimicrobiia bacterium]|nr:hypothetical protein [Acidimicrobiia bacterium]